MAGPPSLSIVIPVYNEPYWIRQSVDAAVAAVRTSPFDDVELVVVDDGSNEETERALGTLTAPFPLRVIRQANAGRFAARSTGIRHTRNELVLLLDSRVVLGPDSLTFLATHLDEPHARLVCNGHVEPAPESNAFGRFWTVPSALFWSRYLANPRTTSYGADEFDWFPKGTGCFVAPRRLLVDALDAFSSLYDDPRHANDDTLLIRSIAARERINISPQFSASYVARSSLSSFLRHAFHRGTVFVDAFGRPGTRFFPVVVGFFPLTLLLAASLVARPRLALLLAAGPPAACGLALAARRPREDAVAFGILALPFAAAYGAGIWRGGLLVLTARRRRRPPRPAARRR